MQEVYKQLLQSLKAGKQAAVVSRYGNSSTVKSLVKEDDVHEWNDLRVTTGFSSPSWNNDEATLVEYYSPKPRLIIMGGGHIALPLSSFGASLGFHVVVFDDRPSFANEARFPDAQTVICDGFTNVVERLKIRKSDYVVIVTRGHRHDSLCLRGVLKGEFPYYVGMIGSKRRIAIVKKQLEDETGASSELAQLHAPIGLSIGAVTPTEITFSILAEIIQRKRLGPSAEKRPDSSNSECDSSPDMELLEWLAKDRTTKAALVTVVSTDGSTPREAGAKMVLLPYGQVVGSIGGGCAEAGVIQKARDIIQKGGYSLMDIDMTDSAEEDGMVCGGTMKVLIEVV